MLKFLSVEDYTDNNHDIKESSEVIDIPIPIWTDQFGLL